MVIAAFQITAEIATISVAALGAAGAIGGTIVKVRGDTKIAELQQQKKTSDEDKVRAESLAKELAIANQRMIESAERREGASNERADKAIEAVGKLSDVVTELSVAVKAISEELRWQRK
jgi:hypothetical protein